MAVDAEDNLYISDSGNFRILEVVKATGQTVVAGNGQNGPRLRRTGHRHIRLAQGMTVDAEGNIFFIDKQNVREVVKATGMIVTLAGFAGGVWLRWG